MSTVFRSSRGVRGYVLPVLLLAGLAVGVVPARSLPASTPIAAEVTEAPDEASAAAMAYRTRKPVLVTSLTTETAQTWAQPDGTYKVSTAAAPVRTRDASGAWVDVDLTLQRRADGSVSPRHGVGDLWLSGARSASSEDLAAAGDGAARTTLGWTGALPEPVLDGAKATYRQVRPGVDLVVEARRTGFEFFLVVANADAADDLSTVELPWDIGDLTPTKHGDGLELRSGSKPVVAVPPAKMWDATVNAAGDPVNTAPVEVSTTVDGTGDAAMVVEPSTEFFDDPSVVYPVTVDPEVTLKPAYDAYVQDGISSSKASDDELKLGYSDDAYEGCGSGCLARSYLSFHGLSVYSGVAVTSATLHLWATHSWSCTPAQWEAWRVDSVGSATNWANQPTYRARTGLSTATKGYSSSCAPDGVEIYVTEAFATTTGNGWDTANLGLKASSESNHNSWKKFASSETDNSKHVPYVEMTYNRPPNTPSNPKIDSCYLACGSPATVRSVRPRLTATFSDPDGGSVSAVFEVWNAARTTMLRSSGTTVTGIVSGAARSWQTTALTDGVKYSWRAKACDKYNCSENYSSWFDFTVDVSNPSLPVVKSTDYPLRSTGQWSGAPGLEGTFTFAPGSSDEVAAYTYQLNDGDAVTVGAGTQGSELLTTNQQKISSGTVGFDKYNATISRATDRGHGDSDSLKVTPDATGVSCGSVGCTFASVGGDPVNGDAGLQLGMQPKHRYELTGWIYVPSATGLTYGSQESAEWQSRGMRLGAYYLVGSAYTAIYSDKATKVNTWQRLSVTMSIPAGASQAFFRLHNSFATGKTTKSVYFDDLSLKELSGNASTVKITPTVDGPGRLSVQARDLAGNISTDPQIYEFLVRPKVGTTWHWGLNEGSGDKAQLDGDDSRPLTLSSGASWTDGEVDTAAVHLDGTGEAVTASPVIDTSNSFTVAAWVQRSEDAAGWRTAASQDGTNTSMFRLGYRDDRDLDGDGAVDKAWCFTVMASDSATAGSVAACTSELVDNAWEHLVGIYDKTSGTIRLYVNGTPSNDGLMVETSVPAGWSAGGAWPATGKFAVGRARQNAAPADRWVGDVDEVYASQSVWTDEEINVKAQR